jgi:hypothetical protein
LEIGAFCIDRRLRLRYRLRVAGFAQVAVGLHERRLCGLNRRFVFVPLQREQQLPLVNERSLLKIHAVQFSLRRRLDGLSVRLESLVVLLLLVVALTVLSRFFFSISNFLNILLATSVIGVLAIGETFVIMRPASIFPSVHSWRSRAPSAHNRSSRSDCRGRSVFSRVFARERLPDSSTAR